MSSTVMDHLDRYFLLSERGTTVSAEIRAGTASFLTLSYLLLVNPQIMAQAGVVHDDAVFATALSAAISCMLVGLIANLPFGCAPGLGLSAYLAFGLVQAELVTLSEALTACWWSGIVVLVVSLTGLANLLMSVVPQSIKLAIVVGMGLLIAMIGMVDVGLVVSNEKTLVELGDVWGDAALQLCLVGIFLVASLLYHDVKGAILIGIAILTLVDWILTNSWPAKVFQVPQYHPNDYWEPWIVLDLEKAAVLYTAIGAFVLICIFDISGVIFGLSTLGGIIDPNTGDIPGSVWCFVASGIGTLVAAWLGSTPIIVCVECASGVREGGRTGLTAVVISLYFTASIFLAPLFSSVPDIATSPVLVLVGVMMMGESAKIKWDNMNEALPAFLTIILMPLTYSITNGMIFGLLAASVFYITTGHVWTDAKGLNLSCSRTEGVEEEGTQFLMVEGADEKNGGKYGSV